VKILRRRRGERGGFLEYAVRKEKQEAQSSFRV